MIHAKTFDTWINWENDVPYIHRNTVMVIHFDIFDR